MSARLSMHISTRLSTLQAVFLSAIANAAHAYIVTHTYIIMDRYSYGLYSYGLHSYGLYSHDLYSSFLHRQCDAHARTHARARTHLYTHMSMSDVSCTCLYACLQWQRRSSSTDAHSYAISTPSRHRRRHVHCAGMGVPSARPRCL